MRISVWLCTVASIVVVVGMFGGLGQLARGAEYTVGVHPLKDKNAPDPVALTNSRGLSLYYSTDDTPTQSKCTGDCTKTWMPLISEAPTKDPKIRGQVSVVHDVHGAQVAYNGHLLYTYADDAAPGEATGHGRGGKWFVATPVLAKW